MNIQSFVFDLYVNLHLQTTAPTPSRIDLDVYQESFPLIIRTEAVDLEHAVEEIRSYLESASRMLLPTEDGAQALCPIDPRSQRFVELVKAEVVDEIPEEEVITDVICEEEPGCLPADAVDRCDCPACS